MRRWAFLVPYSRFPLVWSEKEMKRALTPRLSIYGLTELCSDTQWILLTGKQMQHRMESSSHFHSRPSPFPNWGRGGFIALHFSLSSFTLLLSVLFVSWWPPSVALNILLSHVASTLFTSIDDFWFGHKSQAIHLYNIFNPKNMYPFYTQETITCTDCTCLTWYG